MIEFDYEGMLKAKRRKIVRESQKRRRDKAKAEGLCVLCCREKVIDGRTLCERCRTQHNERVAKSR